MSDKKIIARQARQIAQLQASLQSALDRIAELEARLSQNSGNSSRPPSSDGLAKNPAFPRSLGKPHGGQQSHQGETLKMVKRANSVIVHRVADVCSCGKDLSEVIGQVSSKRQVFDLPPQALVVTQHQCERKTCLSCGKLHQSSFPAGVNAPVQYGNRVKSLVSLLSVGHNMPVGGIKSLFADLFGYALNEATIQGANALYYEQLTEEERIIRDELQQQTVIHADESGVRTEGKLHWLHIVSSRLLTYEQGSQWTVLMHELLLSTYLATGKGRGFLTQTALQSTQSKYEAILQQADREEPPPQPSARERDKQSKGRNLMNRLTTHQAAVLAFARYQSVPFTNNLAERDIRPWKTKLKVSGCFRTTTGADYYARIRSFISTARKQRKQVFKELCRVLDGESFLRDLKTT